MMIYHRVYVISDNPKLSSRRLSNTMCFDVRTIHHKNRKMVLASDNKNILKYVQDARDDYCITEIHPVTLKDYCVKNRVDVVHVSGCRCDVDTQDVVCNIDEIYLDELVAGVDDTDAGVGADAGAGAVLFR